MHGCYTHNRANVCVRMCKFVCACAANEVTPAYTRSMFVRWGVCVMLCVRMRCGTMSIPCQNVPAAPKRRHPAPSLTSCGDPQQTSSHTVWSKSKARTLNAIIALRSSRSAFTALNHPRTTPRPSVLGGRYTCMWAEWKVMPSDFEWILPRTDTHKYPRQTHPRWHACSPKLLSFDIISRPKSIPLVYQARPHRCHSTCVDA